ncbi:MAG: hypothetical protein HGA22_06410 [Clostridiales bacterium]|nr:hypothetical protein [Clostridiales bacterium]
MCHTMHKSTFYPLLFFVIFLVGFFGMFSPLNTTAVFAAGEKSDSAAASVTYGFVTPLDEKIILTATPPNSDIRGDAVLNENSLLLYEKSASGTHAFISRHSLDTMSPGSSGSSNVMRLAVISDGANTGYIRITDALLDKNDSLVTNDSIVKISLEGISKPGKYSGTLEDGTQIYVKVRSNVISAGLAILAGLLLAILLSLFSPFMINFGLFTSVKALKADYMLKYSSVLKSLTNSGYSHFLPDMKFIDDCFKLIDDYTKKGSFLSFFYNPKDINYTKGQNMYTDFKNGLSAMETYLSIPDASSGELIKGIAAVSAALDKPDGLKKQAPVLYSLFRKQLENGSYVKESILHEPFQYQATFISDSVNCITLIQKINDKLVELNNELLALRDLDLDNDERTILDISGKTLGSAGKMIARASTSSELKELLSSIITTEAKLDIIQENHTGFKEAAEKMERLLTSLEDSAAPVVSRIMAFAEGFAPSLFDLEQLKAQTASSDKKGSFIALLRKSMSNVIIPALKALWNLLDVFVSIFIVLVLVAIPIAIGLVLFYYPNEVFGSTQDYLLLILLSTGVSPAAKILTAFSDTYLVGKISTRKQASAAK